VCKGGELERAREEERLRVKLADDAEGERGGVERGRCEELIHLAKVEPEALRMKVEAMFSWLVDDKIWDD